MRVKSFLKIASLQSGLLLLIVMINIIIIYAQPPQISSGMTMPDQNYFELEQSLDVYYTQNPAQVSSTEKKVFSRWSWFWGSRVGLCQTNDASQLAATNSLLNQLNAYQAQSTTGQSNWIHKGPKTYTSQNYGIVISLAIDPKNDSILYAGTNASGLWKTSNRFNIDPEWQPITESTRLPGLGVNDILINPQNPKTIYIATGITASDRGYGLGVLKSNDGGKTWNTTSLSYITQQGQVTRKLIMHPNDTNAMYALVNQKVFKTSDGWNSYTEKFNQLSSPNKFLRDIAMQPNNPNIIYISSDDKGLDDGKVEIWKTADGGDNWVTIHENFNSDPNIADIKKAERVSLAVTPADSNAIYACYRGVGDNFYIHKSRDGGNTWRTLLNPGKAAQNGFNLADYWRLEFEVSPNDTSVMYVGGGQITRICLYCPSQVTTQNNGHIDVRAMIFASAGPIDSGKQDILITGNDGGVSLTEDGWRSRRALNGTTDSLLGAETWLQLHYELTRFATYNPNIYTSTYSLDSIIRANKNRVPLGIISLEYDKIKEESLDSGWLYIQNNQLLYKINIYSYQYLLYFYTT